MSDSSLSHIVLCKKVKVIYLTLPLVSQPRVISAPREMYLYTYIHIYIHLTDVAWGWGENSGRYWK